MTALVSTDDDGSLLVESESGDGLFGYVLSPSPDGSWTVVVRSVRDGSVTDETPFEGFADEAAARVFRDAHAGSEDLGVFALLRATRAMHAWARQSGRDLDPSTVAEMVEVG